MERKTIHIEGEPVEYTRKFLDSLFAAKIPESHYWFSKVNWEVSTGKQEADEQMNLEFYLSHITPKSSVRIQFIDEEALIRIMSRNVTLSTSPEVERAAWYECPLIESNYLTIERVYREAYGKEIK